eukprot:c12918_g1_i1.p1 GENE.c12918_g1_i1~~c12918_g1_i1.p1  ORF type:complete len:297 (-),score=69.54 c12918_g1_i1:72-962(-)
MDLASFKILGLLGEGRFSKVYRAVDPKTNTLYALKVLEKAEVRRLAMRHKALYDELAMEVKLLKTMKHRNIIPFVKSDQNESNLFIAFEHEQGTIELLALLLRAGKDKKHLQPVSIEVARCVIAQLVEALEYLKTLDIVHRDVKLENMVVTPAGVIQLIDFSTALCPAYAELKSTKMAGTAQFMAPEVLAKEEQTLGVDLWAVGCVLYLLLTGTHAFDAGSDYLILMRVESGEYTIPEQIPEAAKDLIANLLQRDPAARLGGDGDFAKLKAHPFFEGVDFGSDYTAPLRDLLAANP